MPLTSWGSYNQIILSNEKTNAEYGIGFACGFYSQQNEAHADSWYLAIGLAEWMDSFPDEQVWYFKDILWLANRNRAVSEHATLQFLSDGNLVLRDGDGSLVWSTGTANKSVVGMKMMKTGNLVLYDTNNKSIWQSFDHPTDTLLPGQKLMRGQKLVASVSNSNLSKGNFNLVVTSRGLDAYYQAEVPLSYCRYPYNEGTSHDVDRIEMESSNGYLSLDILSTEGVLLYTSYQQYRNKTSYMKLDPDGHLRFYDDKSRDQSFDLLADYMNECDYPLSCGSYGLCTNGVCSCLPGFAPTDASNGQSAVECSQINPITCENPSSHFLLPYEDIHYFSYEAAIGNVTDMNSCKEACLKTCSCTVALFRFYDNTSIGDCVLPSPVLSLTKEGKETYKYQSYAFIKMSNDGEIRQGGDANSNARQPERSSSRSVNHSITIIGSTLGALILVGLVFGFFWIVFFGKKKDGEEEGIEDYLDELSGMPVRFTYKELKIATENFQKKLGAGGFGSVFEGNSLTGDKIAVKRLDSLGQGKKEFLAEVKTIGSIHHNSLVRLIGFCAEKLHRLLVYEFMSYGSLDKWIFFQEPFQPPLDWQTRRKIIWDVAKGLAYLHEDCRQRIIHLDIKPQNILLDANLHAKISDFGLSKLIDRDQSQSVTTMRGTPGYMAPELFHSVITEKADVYSFGIVVMEVVCGRKNLDRSQPEGCMHLLPIFMRKAEEHQLMDMVDKSSEDMELHKSEAVEMMKVAIWCLQSNYTRRPSMSMVVKVLEGTVEVEADLDYTIQHPTTMAPIRIEANLENTTTLLRPSLLSAPR
ncbi:hypothetical protein JCGZ_21614 [Jatropha curcas]|uniref:Receptor-like serine/threonine-protein kinase n=2 Tax=Jatropha curcas TaxID=180498 RepID=A0A067JEE7_JATCU|nr:hypothetical protein JCGZ_21614 [Jatropha curcas]